MPEIDYSQSSPLRGRSRFLQSLGFCSILRLLQHHQVKMQRVKESVSDNSMIGSRGEKPHLQRQLTIHYYDHVSFCKSVKAINIYLSLAKKKVLTHNTT